MADETEQAPAIVPDELVEAVERVLRSYADPVMDSEDIAALALCDRQKHNVVCGCHVAPISGR